jgi:hypothetical protein
VLQHCARMVMAEWIIGWVAGSPSTSHNVCSLSEQTVVINSCSMMLMMGPLQAKNNFLGSYIVYDLLMVLPGNLSDDKASKDNTHCLWGRCRWCALMAAIPLLSSKELYATMSITQQSALHNNQPKHN